MPGRRTSPATVDTPGSLVGRPAADDTARVTGSARVTDSAREVLDTAARGTARDPEERPHLPGAPPVIGLATGRIAMGERVIDGTQQEYAQRITEAGGAAVLLPVQPTGSLASILARVDGLLFTGGGDVDPHRYGAEPSVESGGIDPDRDGAEAFLLEEAARLGIPVLAVCRGIQILNVARGGSLVQHLPSVSPEPHLVIERRTQAVHSVRVDPDSWLCRMAGKDRLETNSLHHQAVDRLGRELTAVAWADDGTVEAVEDRKRQMVAVQWHPEQMPDRPEQMRLFAWLVARARDRRPPVGPGSRPGSVPGPHRS